MRRRGDGQANRNADNKNPAMRRDQMLSADIHRTGAESEDGARSWTRTNDPLINSREKLSVNSNACRGELYTNDP